MGFLHLESHVALYCELSGEICPPSFMGATLTAGLEWDVATDWDQPDSF